MGFIAIFDGTFVFRDCLVQLRRQSRQCRGAIWDDDIGLRTMPCGEGAPAGMASNMVAADIRRDIRNSPLAGRCFRFAEGDRDDGKRIDKHRLLVCFNFVLLEPFKHCSLRLDRTQTKAKTGHDLSQH